jgi:hypothetical protein
MDKVQKTDPSNTTSSSKTFRDQLRTVVCIVLVYVEWAEYLHLRCDTIFLRYPISSSKVKHLSVQDSILNHPHALLVISN